ncbi:TetR/AcrR family transcriptional regulator [Actinomadura graeca]|uniref:TetR/AcrR family transcriptional regulator n=1 Tax=Actinomadura graeca TaxID=2750812 RepID=A0ABX8QPD2_9ACTN|nr:TetR/AcrR family transcriptional regulator [Actinomadura graeca]QXJ19764.1 TetR/AcrR family transcriptional regulator [Actinomadura graeca]
MSGGEHVSIWSVPERQGRGPRPAYSRAQITEAAVRIADADGLEAASMRRIAAELGTGAMSLYRYVPSRDDLIELMYDHVVAVPGLPERPTGDWRADLALVARASRATLLAHPWVAGLNRSRLTYGPNQLRLLEFALGALDVGIPVDEMLTLVGMLNGYVELDVRRELEWRREYRRSGLTPEDWMMRTGPRVRELMESGDYPMFTRVIVDARIPHMTGDEQFEYGLGRVLDCIASALPGPPAGTAPRG